MCIFSNKAGSVDYEGPFFFRNASFPWGSPACWVAATVNVSCSLY